jgi:transcription elongation factor S-II
MSREPSTQPLSPTVQRTIASDDVEFESTGDTVRDRCLGLIYQALASDSTTDGKLILTRASRIEQVVFEEAESKASEAYRTRIRTYFVRLKAKDNPGLRHGIVEGSILPDAFCRMSDAVLVWFSVDGV